MDYRIIPFQEVGLSDDFMFGEVMRDERVCRLFLENLLQTRIARIEYIDKQADLTDDYIAHGVRLDVYLGDENNTRYDIEMQNVRDPSMERRARYYQSAIDRRFLEQGEDYEALPNSYVIFICGHDPYHKGLAQYERISAFRDCSDAVYDDGAYFFALNTRYKIGNAPRPVLDFLDLIRTNEIGAEAGELAREAYAALNRVRHDPSKEVGYMTLTMKYRDIRREGMEIGRAEGRTEAYRNALRMGLPPELALKVSGLTQEEAARLGAADAEHK